MFSYFKIQFKRFIKISPVIFAVSLIFFFAVALLFWGFKSEFESDESRAEFTVGVTGDIDNKYFQIGIKAFNTMDSSSVSLELVEVDEEKAPQMLKDGKLSAYLVIPEGFVKSATKGKILPVSFVTIDSNTGLVGIVRDEITEIIGDMVKSGQKGVFATQNVLEDNGYEDVAQELKIETNIAFIALALARNDLFKEVELGVSSGLNSYVAFACGILVLFILLSGTVYAVVLIRRDNSMSRLLISRGRGCTKQIFSEFFALTLSFYPVIAVIVSVGLYFVGNALGTDVKMFTVFLALLPAVALICAFNMLLFEISDKIVTGMLIQFFSALFLSYMSGCLLPISSLPSILQRVAMWLPTGCVRVWIEGAVAQNVSLEGLLRILAYSLILLILASMVRFMRVRRIA